MRRSGQVKWGNLWIGILVTFAIMMLIYASFHGGSTSFFEEKDTLTAYFPNVGGLVTGAPVWLGGVEVGNVRSIQFVNLDDYRRIRVDFVISSTAWQFVTQDSRATLGTIGVLGDKYVEVIPGSKDLPLVEPGAVLPTVRATGFEALFTEAPQTLDAIDGLMQSMTELTEKIKSGEGTIGKAFSDTALYVSMVSALEQTAAVMGELKKSQKEIQDKLATLLDKSSVVAGSLADGNGSAGRMLTDTSLYTHLAASSARLDSILAKIERGDGTAGALVTDDRLYEEIYNLLTRANNLISDIQANPRKYFKFSVF